MRWRPCGDSAALAEVDDLEEVLRLHTAVVEAGLDVVDLVPGARTLLVRCRDEGTLERVAGAIDALTLPDHVPESGEKVTIPVTYDGEDLDDVADHLGVDRDEVVRRHVEAPWRVAFTGFAPGFGYLVADGSRLEVPRRAESRTRVPAGAVGLAGEFSGVYPRPSPGGWQLIGSTEVTPWDLDRDPPALLRPGALVRFEVA